MKNARHQLILELIQEFDIETQEDLASRLNSAGFNVTQATISRDIKQLQLHKVHTSKGTQKYCRDIDSVVNLADKHRRILKDSFVSIDFSGNIAVIHTISGMAMATGAALDSFDWKEVLGCIAGDDTIFAVLRDEEDKEELKNKINAILAEQ